MDRKWTKLSFVGSREEHLDKDAPWPIIDQKIIEEHNNTHLDNWETQFFLLPNPLLIKPDIKTIIEIDKEEKKARLYPPFSLNILKSKSSYFENSRYPFGNNSVENLKDFPPESFRGFDINPRIESDDEVAHAVRIDIEQGFPSDSLFTELLEQITQFTWQWWLRSPQSPFSGAHFMSASITKDYDIFQKLRYRDAGKIETTWRPHLPIQEKLKFERALSEEMWRECGNYIKRGVPSELGILSFCDGVAHYMANDDRRAIMDFAISFEILANKMLSLKSEKTASSLKELLKRTSLAQGKTQEILQKLVIDRGHVAHGNEPYIIKHHPDMMIKYLEAARKVMGTYLTSVSGDEFAKMARPLK